MGLVASQFLFQGKREKAMRWIGFVQGALWTMGLRSIDAMREDNTDSVDSDDRT